MKKIYLQKISQFGTECYIGKIDPRELVKIASKIEMGTVQDAQRPLNATRVKDIANYVDTEAGILPNTLTLATNDGIIEVLEEETINNLFYIDFPTTESEYKNYEGTIDVLDGQHRLYSFLPDIRKLSDDAVFEIGFTLFIQPTLSEQRRIFISCNEKQEKVSGNLLMWFRDKLQMLSNDEKELYGIVSELNKNNPLKGRIIMSAEKIKNGIKANELLKIIKAAKLKDLSIGTKKLTDEEIVKITCMYLTAWESVVGFDFTSSTAKIAGAAIKTAGIRYMISILPAFWERSVAHEIKFNKEYLEDTIKQLISAFGVERSQFFTDDSIKMSFRDRTATDKLVNDSKHIITGLGRETFNPLG